MADNYLEKKFEEYAAHKSTGKNKKNRVNRPKTGAYRSTFPTRGYLLPAGQTE